MEFMDSEVLEREGREREGRNEMRHRFGTAVRTCVTLCSNALSRFTSFRLRSARNVRAHSRKPDACRWWRHTIKGAEDTTCSVFMRALTALTNTLRYAYQALARVNVHGSKCTAQATHKQPAMCIYVR